MKSILTEYMETCAICGSPNVEIHHLDYGNSKRKLSDDDGLIIPLCPKHHNDSKYLSVHGNPVISAWSRIAGQLAWEKQAVINGMTADEAREAYRKRYGKSHL